MKKDFMTRFNFISNILILTLLIGGGLIYADTNGLWTRAEDIKSGTFGADEGGNFTFNTSVNFTNNVTYKSQELDQRFLKVDDIPTHPAIPRLFDVACPNSEQTVVGFDTDGAIICDCSSSYHNYNCNFARGKSYTLSPPPNSFKGAYYPDNTGNDLINGAYTTWDVGWYNIPTEITLDLGAQYYNVRVLRLYVTDNDGGADANNPAYVTYSHSLDGTSFNNLGTVNEGSMQIRSGGSKYFELDLTSSPIPQTRYIRFNVPSPHPWHWLMIEEIEVYG